MELLRAQNPCFFQPSLCVASSSCPHLQPIHSSLPFVYPSLFPSKAERPSSSSPFSSSFCSIVAKARPSDSKAPPPPRPELWELEEYDDPNDDTAGEQKKSRARRRTFETEADARRHHYISRMWAPWEEALGPEAQFAVDALNLDQGEEPIVPIEMMDRLDVNKPIIPDAILDGTEEIPEDPDVLEAIENGAMPGTVWKTPMAYALIPPRDWPPPGWKVDPDELAFIRSIHGIMEAQVTPIDVSKAVPFTEENQINRPRWKMFLKQYEEWAAANKERLDREAEEVGDEYYPGRRRMGENYVDGMYELPFVYPGQQYVGEVTMVHLYEGAFIFFGAVHDGWVPIKRNDWYWVRKHIKVGMRVQVEVIAKRDPYRFRFPVEMRFVQPNIDHLIFNRFEFPPIFVRKEEEENMDLITREAGRPFWPRRRPDQEETEEIVPKINHPFSFKVWQLHVAEQMLLDDEENKAAGIVTPQEKLNEVTTERTYLDADTFWTEEKLGKHTYPSLVLTQHEWELDMDAARKEREVVNKARDEAFSRGETFTTPKLARTLYIEKLDFMNWQRYLDEHEALQRDKVNRLEFGMPLEEPGKYADDSFFGGENKYNPREKRWRHDYMGDLSKSKNDSKHQRESQPPNDEKGKEGNGRGGGTLGRKGSKAVGTSKDEASEEFSSEAVTGAETMFNGKKVNGTESSQIPGINGLFRISRDDESSEDERE